jgi:hypothetical protein
MRRIKSIASAPRLAPSESVSTAILFRNAPPESLTQQKDLAERIFLIAVAQTPLQERAVLLLRFGRGVPLPNK